MYCEIFLLCFLASVSGSVVNETEIQSVDATVFEFPQLVSLRLNNSHICTATILTETLLLTAAHCVRLNVSFYSIQFGLTRIIEEANATNVIQVANIMSHHNYFPGTEHSRRHDDIAVIELASPLKFGSNVQPVNLPEASNVTPESKIAATAGWRVPDTGDFEVKVLQKPQLFVYPDRRCKNITVEERDENLCVKILQGVICNGDSGGPVLVDGTLVGIVSWNSENCALEGFKVLFVEIQTYLQWIEDKIHPKQQQSKEPSGFSLSKFFSKLFG